MKLNNFAVVPASVRYDPKLTLSALRVYMEIAAATNVLGECEADHVLISKSIGLNNRTVKNSLNLLIECGHLKESIVDGYQWLKLIFKGAEPLKETPVAKPRENLIPFFDKLISLWEKGLSTRIHAQEFYYPLIEQRLVRFTKEELLSSVENRIHFITKTSTWHTDPSKRQYQVDLSILLRDDDTVHKYLNLKPDNNENQLIKFQ